MTETIENQILHQVEFYFGDQNLPKDKFLWLATQKRDGWVPISVIASFARMREYKQPLNVIVDALKKSKSLLQVNDDETMVRRKVPLVEPSKDEKQSAFLRSVYAKGFPIKQQDNNKKDGDDENIAPLPTADPTQIEIENFFAQFGEIKQVRLRRDEDKKFKGSVFCEFANQHVADKFIELANNEDSTKRPKYNNQQELLVMSKKAYVDMKAAQGKFAKSNDNNNKQHRRRNFDAFREIKTKSKDNKRVPKVTSSSNNKKQPNNDAKRPADDAQEPAVKKAKVDEGENGNENENGN